jgi:hypothetical protein
MSVALVAIVSSLCPVGSSVVAISAWGVHGHVGDGGGKKCMVTHFGRRWWLSHRAVLPLIVAVVQVSSAMVAMTSAVVQVISVLVAIGD